MTGLGSVARRLLSLNEALESLAMPEAGDAARLATDRVLRAAVERWLQVTIEACIDLAQHACAVRGWPPPDSANAQEPGKTYSEFQLARILLTV